MRTGPAPNVPGPGEICLACNVDAMEGKPMKSAAARAVQTRWEEMRANGFKDRGHRAFAMFESDSLASLQPTGRITNGQNQWVKNSVPFQRYRLGSSMIRRRIRSFR